VAVAVGEWPDQVLAVAVREGGGGSGRRPGSGTGSGFGSGSGSGLNSGLNGSGSGSGVNGSGSGVNGSGSGFSGSGSGANSGAVTSGGVDPRRFVWRGPRLTMALHTATATVDTATATAEYRGVAVAVAVALHEAAHAGQIVASRDTATARGVRELLADGDRLWQLAVGDSHTATHTATHTDMDASTAAATATASGSGSVTNSGSGSEPALVTPLGKHRLKGVETPVEVFQINPP
jgi:hypothetical protein